MSAQESVVNLFVRSRVSSLLRMSADSHGPKLKVRVTFKLALVRESLMFETITDDW